MALHGAHQSAQKSMTAVFPLLICAIDVKINTYDVVRTYEFIVLLSSLYHGDCIVCHV